MFYCNVRNYISVYYQIEKKIRIPFEFNLDLKRICNINTYTVYILHILSIYFIYYYIL